MCLYCDIMFYWSGISLTLGFGGFVWLVSYAGYKVYKARKEA